MKKEIYCNDLFEDELHELFRALKKGDYIQYEDVRYYAKPTINYDGIVITEKDMFRLEDRGKGNAYINENFLVDILAHKTFTVFMET